MQDPGPRRGPELSHAYLMGGAYAMRWELLVLQQTLGNKVEIEPILAYQLAAHAATLRRPFSLSASISFLPCYSQLSG